MDIKAESKKRAAYAQLSMVDDALNEAHKLDSDAVPFEELRTELISHLRSAWDKDGYRTSYVYRENSNAAFVHATIAVQESEEVRAVWPYWWFNAVMDQKTSQHCDSLNNTVRPAAEAWWYDGRIPPLHFGGCRSLILGITMKEAHRIGVTPYYPLVQGDVHHGYGYARRGFQPDLSKFPAELTQIYDQAVHKKEEASLSPLEQFAAGMPHRWPGGISALDAFKLETDDDDLAALLSSISDEVRALYDSALEMAEAVLVAIEPPRLPPPTSPALHD